jgi:hypothetical protein
LVDGRADRSGEPGVPTDAGADTVPTGNPEAAVRPAFRVLAAIALSAAWCGMARSQEPARDKPAVEMHPDGRVTVRGRVVYSDLKQDRHEHVDGRGKATLWFAAEGQTEGGFGSPCDIDIVAGAWTVTFRQPIAGAHPTRISMESCRVDDTAVVVVGEAIALEHAQDVRFELRAIPELRLRVVDQSKKDIAGVEVWQSKDWMSSGTLHPGNAEKLLVVGGERSPVKVPAPEDVREGQNTRLWVRAPGYAWQPVEVFLAQGGTRDVVLSQCGTLSVAILGQSPTDPVQPTLRIYDAADAHSMLAEFGSVGANEEIDGLAAGKYEVRVELGEWFSEPAVLARATVEIEAGKRAQVNLTAVQKPAPSKAPLRGVIAIPAAWQIGRDAIRVELEPLGALQPYADRQLFSGGRIQRGDRDGEYRLQAEDLPVGRYALTIDPVGWSCLVSVAEGAPEFRVEVTEPVDVVLRIVDADTGAPCKGLTLSWYPPPPIGVHGWSPTRVGEAAESNEFRFRVPAGRICVDTFGEDYQIPMRTIRVSPDSREFELAAHPVYGIEVVVHEGDTVLPTDFQTGWSFDLRKLGGESVQMGWMGSNILTVSKPGTYVLSVKAPKGYRQVPDRQVKVTTSPFPKIEFVVSRD